MHESSCLAQWMTDPAWPAMDPTAQGFHTRLLLLAAQRRPRGVLPDDDRQWRKWLGLPPAGAQWMVEEFSAVWGQALPPAKPTSRSKAKATPIPEVLSSVLEASWAGEAPPAVARRSYEGWVDWLWTTRWRPQIEAAWTRIDEDVLLAHPGLRAHQGHWFHPLARMLGEAAGSHGSSFRSDASGKTAKPRTTAKARVPSVDTLPAAWSGWQGPEGRLRPSVITTIQVDLDALSQHEAVWKAWQAPLALSDRKSLWEVGVACLAQGGTPPEQRAARDQLGKLIAQYGETPVAQAVAKLALRPLPPADALPFLIGMLRTEDEGTPAERRARERRGHLAL